MTTNQHSTGQLRHKALSCIAKAAYALKGRPEMTPAQRQHQLTDALMALNLATMAVTEALHNSAQAALTEEAVTTDVQSLLGDLESMLSTTAAEDGGEA